MLTKFLSAFSEHPMVRTKGQHLETTLWAVWTLFVATFAVIHWEFDLAAGRPALAGLIIHTTLAGVAGLIVMTLIEMRLNPERFEQSCD